MSDAVLLAVLIFMVAILYSSVGQAGGTGYLAAMALVGVAPVTMRPTALALNVIVASIATITFYRAGQVSLRALWPLLAASIPMAYLGGSVHLSQSVYNPIVGIVLIAASLRMFVTVRTADTRGDRRESTLPVGRALLSGAAIGLLSGLTGTGGGVYLSPLLLFTGWTAAASVAGMAAVFNLVNSAAGLTGNLIGSGTLPAAFPVWALAAVGGGVLGSRYGSRRSGSLTTQRILGVILLIAGVRLFVG